MAEIPFPVYKPDFCLYFYLYQIAYSNSPHYLTNIIFLWIYNFQSEPNISITFVYIV